MKIPVGRNVAVATLRCASLLITAPVLLADDPPQRSRGSPPADFGPTVNSRSNDLGACIVNDGLGLPSGPGRAGAFRGFGILASHPAAENDPRRAPQDSGVPLDTAANSRSWDAAIEHGLKLQESGQYSDAKRVFLGALKEAEAFPPQDLRRPITLANLASVYQDLGEVALAREAYEHAIAGFERSQGKAHPVLAKPLHNLATLYVEQGRFAGAERLSRRGLALHADGAELSAEDRVILRHGLAAALLGQGRAAQAEAIFRQILGDLLVRPAPPLRQIAQIRNNLGLLCTQTRRLKEALFELREAVAAEERALGAEHPELLKPLSNLAVVYSTMGDNGDAEAILKRALAIARRSLGEGEAYGRILSTYAVVLRKLNRRTAAKEAEERAAAILSAVGRDPSFQYTVDIGDLLGPTRPR